MERFEPDASSDWATIADDFLGVYFGSAGKVRPPPALLQRYRDANESELAELAALLRHPHRRLLVALLYRDTACLPLLLVEAMLAAGIEEPDPSFNRAYLDPCFDVLGAPTVLSRLLDEVEHGDNPAGAAQALYWTWVRISRDNVEVCALRERARALLLTVFVERDDPTLRRSIVRRLELGKPSVYASSLQPLVTRAIEIGRASEDEFLRAEIELQLGNFVGSRPSR